MHLEWNHTLDGTVSSVRFDAISKIAVRFLTLAALRRVFHAPTLCGDDNRLALSALS